MAMNEARRFFFMAAQCLAHRDRRYPLRMPSDSSIASPLARRVLATGAVVVALILTFVLGQRLSGTPSLPPASSSHIEVKPTPNVIVAMRALSRLETETYHMERVIELTDEQTKLYGLLR